MLLGLQSRPCWGRVPRETGRLGEGLRPLDPLRRDTVGGAREWPAGSSESPWQSRRHAKPRPSETDRDRVAPTSTAKTTPVRPKGSVWAATLALGKDLRLTPPSSTHRRESSGEGLERVEGSEVWSPRRRGTPGRNRRRERRGREEAERTIRFPSPRRSERGRMKQGRKKNRLF